MAAAARGNTEPDEKNIMDDGDWQTNPWVHWQTKEIGRQAAEQIGRQTSQQTGRPALT
jgi:hypothetical protein